MDCNVWAAKIKKERKYQTPETGVEKFIAFDSRKNTIYRSSKFTRNYANETKAF